MHRRIRGTRIRVYRCGPPYPPILSHSPHPLTRPAGPLCQRARVQPATSITSLPLASRPCRWRHVPVAGVTSLSLASRPCRWRHAPSRPAGLHPLRAARPAFRPGRGPGYPRPGQGGQWGQGGYGEGDGEGDEEGDALEVGEEVWEAAGWRRLRVFADDSRSGPPGVPHPVCRAGEGRDVTSPSQAPWASESGRRDPETQGPPVRVTRRRRRRRPSLCTPGRVRPAGRRRAGGAGPAPCSRRQRLVRGHAPGRARRLPAASRGGPVSTRECRRQAPHLAFACRTVAPN